MPFRTYGSENSLSRLCCGETELAVATRTNMVFIVGANMTPFATYCCRRQWNGRKLCSYILQEWAVRRVRRWGDSWFRQSIIRIIATRGNNHQLLSCLYARRKFWNHGFQMAFLYTFFATEKSIPPEAIQRKTSNSKSTSRSKPRNNPLHYTSTNSNLPSNKY